QPCAFGFVAKSCDTPGVTASLIHMRQQYTQQWNFSVERQFGSRMSGTIAYVGNKTLHLQQGIRRNDPPPGPGAIQSRRLYPEWELAMAQIRSRWLESFSGCNAEIGIAVHPDHHWRRGKYGCRLPASERSRSACSGRRCFVLVLCLELSQLPRTGAEYHGHIH